jgi:hypothetical protein
LPEQWKQLIVVLVYEEGDKTDFRNYRDVSILSTTYKILSNVLLERLTPYTEEITGDNKCGFQHSRSTIYQVLCVRQILENKWEYIAAVHRLL